MRVYTLMAQAHPVSHSRGSVERSEAVSSNTERTLMAMTCTGVMLCPHQRLSVSLLRTLCEQSANIVDDDVFTRRQCEACSQGSTNGENQHATRQTPEGRRKARHKHHKHERCYRGGVLCRRHAVESGKRTGKDKDKRTTTWSAYTRDINTEWKRQTPHGKDAIVRVTPSQRHDTERGIQESLRLLTHVRGINSGV